MAEKTKFVCQTCGYESLKWLGKCPSCGEWSTFSEEIVLNKNSQKKSQGILPSSNNKPTQFKFTEMTMENTAPQIKRPNHNPNNNNVIIIDVPKPKPNHYPHHHQQHQPHQQPFNNSGGFVSEGMNPVIHANFDEPINPPSTNAADFKAKLERRRKGLNKSNNQP